MNMVDATAHPWRAIDGSGHDIEAWRPESTYPEALGSARHGAQHNLHPHPHPHPNPHQHQHQPNTPPLVSAVTQAGFTLSNESHLSKMMMVGQEGGNGNGKGGGYHRHQQQQPPYQQQQNQQQQNQQQQHRQQQGVKGPQRADPQQKQQDQRRWTAVVDKEKWSETTTAPPSPPVPVPDYETQRAGTNPHSDDKSSGWSKERKILVGVVTLLTLAIIALTVVLGLTLSKNASSSPPTTSTTPSPSSTAYPMIQSPKTAVGPGGVDFECPGAGDTLYTSTYTSAASGTRTVVYLRQCSQDYNQQDLRNLTAFDFGTCMDACTEWNANKADDEDACVAATWFYSQPQGTDDSYCWLKSGTGNPRKGTWWESAIIYTGE